MAANKGEEKSPPLPEYKGQTYVEMLRTIAKNEAVTEKVLLAWADACQDAGVAATLRFVAMREGEHGIAFRKRVLELTGELLPAPGGNDGRFGPDALSTAGDKGLSDKDKFKKLLGRPRDLSNTAFGDIFTTMFDNKEIDPVTGGLLGRFICEERDSANLLDGAVDKVLAAAATKAEKAADGGPPAAAPAPSGALELLDQLERLSALRTAKTVTAEEFAAAKAVLLKLPVSKI